MRLKTDQNTLINSDKINESAKKWALSNWEYLTQTNTPLVNVNSSTKIEKGEKLNVFTAILYLKPADLVAMKTICAAADLFGCKRGCLESSGQLGMKTADNAKIKRTICHLLEPVRFESELRREIVRHYNKHGDKLAVRLNGTSDINFNTLIESLPTVQFYDYTKILHRVKSNGLANYDLTFSGSANSDKALEITARAIKLGHRTVLAVNTAETKGEYKLPERIGLIPLLNMDDTDVRFKDKRDSIGVLKRKGSNKTERATDEIRPNFFFNKSTLAQLGQLIEV